MPTVNERIRGKPLGKGLFVLISKSLGQSYEPLTISYNNMRKSCPISCLMNIINFLSNLHTAHLHC